MTSRLVALSFDANDPVRLERFWAAALRWDIDESPDEIALVPTDDTRFRILSVRCRSRRRAKNRIHLDLTTTTLADQRETVEQLVEFGARHVDIGQGPDDEHVVLADPEGNELCVIEPGNNFLADCAVSDRSPATARGRSAASGAKCSDGRWSGIRTKRPRSGPDGTGRSSPGVRHSCPSPGRTGSTSRSLRPATLVSEQSWTASSLSQRPHSTSATAQSTGR